MEGTNLPSGSQLAILDEIDSTSSEIKRRAATAGLDDKIWILAKKQANGYGRHSKKWHQKEGDFAGSFLINPQATPGKITELPFLVGLAVRQTLEVFLDKADHRLSLKWPNDILLDTKKISGILLELIPRQNQNFLSIGIGINIVSAPQGLPYPTACLGDYGVTPSIESVVETLDRHLHEWLETWHRQGFALIRQAWCDHAEGIGSNINVHLPDKIISGRFETINDQGCLILDDNGHRTALNTGEVFFAGG